MSTWSSMSNLLAQLGNICLLARQERCGGGWAEQEAGSACLGDIRRTQRLVCIVERAALQPGPVVTQLFANSPKEMAAAYDFFENDAVCASEIARAHHIASARRASMENLVFVAVDGSSVRADHAQGTGSIGSRKSGAKGLKTMLALAISSQGVPLGLVGSHFWARGEKAKKHRHRRPIGQKETRYWHDVQEQALENLSKHAPSTNVWLQEDREADSWSLVLSAVQCAGAHYTTIRARTDRKLVSDPDGQDETEPGGKLFAALERQEVQATYEMHVPAANKRKERVAHMRMRWVEVTLDMKEQQSSRRHRACVFAVLAEEHGTTPEKEKPVRWLLLTTYPVETVEDACRVLYGYSLRWKIEELHAAWKTRGCAVEGSKLETGANLERFFTVMLMVAVRLIRLTYLGRQCSGLRASTEFSALESQALLIAHGRHDEDFTKLSVGEAVVLLAKLGGHVGDPSKRPIGFKVLARGLRELRPIARLLERLSAPRTRDAQGANAGRKPPASQVPTCRVGDANTPVGEHHTHEAEEFVMAGEIK